MSNEELAVKIRAGERELLLELWQQVKGLVVQLARRRLLLSDGLGGVDAEDLVQSGFLALLEAVEAFDPSSGYKFTAYLINRLKTSFSIAGNYRTRRQALDPLQRCKSLDAPVGDGEDGETLADFQADPADPFETIEQDVWTEQLHAALERALDALPEREKAVLSLRYWTGATQAEAGERIGVSANRAAQLEKQALRRLRMNARRNGLAQFVEERTPYYAKVCVSSFTATHTSAVEYAVLERERLEKEFLSTRPEA